MKAQGVIEKGAIWKVGSGQMIDVWHHRWLPDLHHNKIISLNVNSSVVRVCDLFLSGMRIWIQAALRVVFYHGKRIW